MTNEEVYKKVEEERRKKEEINQKWAEFKCPVCGESHFRSGRTYSLLDVGKLVDAFKGRHTSGSEYDVTPCECQVCGYVALRKGK